jgi:hypothetical protein
MIIEVQLYHDSTGWFVISEPDGWPDAKLGFERHEDAFHCLVEFFRSAFRAYGSNGIDNGGRDKIKAIERDFGPSALIKSLIRIKETEFDEFEDFYHGQIPVVSLQEVIDEQHTVGFTIEQNDTWSKFISNLEKPVNIQSPTSQDGTSVTVIDPIEIPLTPQPIRAILHNKQETGVNTGTIYDAGFTSPDFQDDLSENQYAQINLDDQVLDELRTNFNIFFQAVSDLELVSEFMSPEIDTQLDIDIKINAALFVYSAPVGGDHNSDIIYYDFGGTTGSVYRLKIFIQIGTDTPIELTRTDKSRTFIPQIPFIYTQTNYWSEYIYSGSTALLPAGTPIKIYAQNSGTAPFGYGNNTFNVLVQNLVFLGDVSNLFEMQPIIEVDQPGAYIQGDTKQLLKDFGTPSGVESYIKLTGKTIFPQTTTTGFLVHDIGRAIIDRICDQDDTLVSNFFGNPSTTPAYAETGCGSNNGGFRGLQIRGWDLTEKQFSISFKDWWEGLDPRYNLSLRPVRDATTGKITIHIEQKKQVYRTDTSSITISNVRKIGKDYDLEHIFNTHRIGWRQWESLDLSGLDDPQTVHDRANNLRGIGKKWESESSWIAASYAVETTRQSRKEKNSDHKYDNETFLIALTPSGGGFVPELDENFSSVTGIRYPEARYNLRHTPARMFIAWLDYLSGMSQIDSGNGFTFQGGEGNYDMESDLENTDCEDYSESVLEKQDIAVSSTFLFIPRLFTFETALTLAEYKAIRNNDDLCIMVSQTATNHVAMLIKDLEFTPYTGQATIKAWAKQWIDLEVPTDDVTIPENMGRIFDESFDLTFE